MKSWLPGVGIGYLVITFLQFFMFTILEASSEQSEKPSGWKTLLYALGWPIYWIKVWLGGE